MLSCLTYCLYLGNREAARIEVLKRIPNVLKIDGDMVKPAEREAAAGTVEA
jgi:hypothetical protein